MFAVLALSSALLCFVLPETRGNPIMDTVMQLERYVINNFKLLPPDFIYASMCLCAKMSRKVMDAF